MRSWFSGIVSIENKRGNEIYEGKNEKPSVSVFSSGLCSAVSCRKRAGCRDGHGGVQLRAYRQGNGAIRGLDVSADLWTLLV